MVMSNRKSLIRLQKFRICLFKFLLQTVLYLIISEIRIYKHSKNTNKAELFLFDDYRAEMLQNSIQRFAEKQNRLLPFT